ncbi:glycerophosphodiester phosphodiesterase [Cohnella silvisoli]|uniref:Glycerophosphodiester phosphodiesterase n=1 Tax=Cohnella silvisoli TaxID=2873699 RepID=A0ABV1KYH6_9BACL|nr:glycerophosphodiester phosphodiesterase [Cohnella silvisoli]MCD9021769.1 glycerophosphodiester phosphodiesterase [Cohnella silvisoli]
MWRKLAVSRGYIYAIHGFLICSLTGLIISILERDIRINNLLPEEHKIAIVAHRGSSGYAPECTLSAYRLGVNMKADYIEIDLRQTLDGELIAMHDETVNRTTNGSGAVKNMTLAEIKALDAGSWYNETEFVDEKVPTLREIFEAFGKDTHYMLETKAPEENSGLEEKVWALVKEFELTDHVAIQSFSKESLLKFRERSNNVPLFQLFWYDRPAQISEALLEEISAYANGIGANFLRINENYVRKVKQAGLLMYPYTVNHKANMTKAVRWGVDGVHTDYPDRFKEVVDKMIIIR